MLTLITRRRDAHKLETPYQQTKHAKHTHTTGGGAGSAYLKEMAQFKATSCADDTKHDRPLVK